jgi:DNA-directed RNA polymerase subunit omega
MLYPSIDVLLTKIDSKYSLVSVASKRARAMHNGGKPTKLENPTSLKCVGRALEEINAGLLTYEIEND